MHHALRRCGGLDVEPLLETFLAIAEAHTLAENHGRDHYVQVIHEVGVEKLAHDPGAATETQVEVPGLVALHTTLVAGSLEPAQDVSREFFSERFARVRQALVGRILEPRERGWQSTMPHPDVRPESVVAQALGWIDATTRAITSPIHMSSSFLCDKDSEQNPCEQLAFVALTTPHSSTAAVLRTRAGPRHVASSEMLSVARDSRLNATLSSAKNRKVTAWLARGSLPDVSMHTVDQLMRGEGWVRVGRVRHRPVLAGNRWSASTAKGTTFVEEGLKMALWRRDHAGHPVATVMGLYKNEALVKGLPFTTGALKGIAVVEPAKRRSRQQNGDMQPGTVEQTHR